ncbi:cobaltochelatase subunit CobN [Leptolyngbya ohadii]|uniref:cobaltochelatase subunit CobN n=1 Tax=Leptolyngbya ohadii TaxID=1962290 RepID=UPI000B5A0B3A|nr:cobaltochelatase subunit CobN [Leptolyngbya ohadii]
MHRLATQPGGWMPDTEGVIFVEQSPAPLVYLTAADTDIQVLAAATGQLPSGFPEVRAVNLLQLQQHLTIDTYAEQVLSQAKAIVLRLLGGRSYWSYGLEVVKQTVEQTGAMLFVLPGDDKPDPELCSHSTVSLTSVDRLWRYFTEGGVENAVNALKFLANTACGTDYETDLPRSIPRVGRYPCPPAPDSPKAGILFYRAHYLAGNTAPIDSLCQALSDRGMEPVPLFVSSLRDGEVQAELLDWFQQKCPIEVLLNATSFSLARLEAETPNVDLWQKLNVPVLQVILSSGTQAQWLEQTRGLSPRDMAMNVALPEVDGRIITRAVSFKAIESRHPMLETDVVGYQPLDDRIQFVADLAANWVQLRQTPVSDRRIALILANYPTKDGRLANGVGLDTPQSCVEILKALQQEGYLVENLPRCIDELTGDDLIALLTRTVTNDPEGQTLRPVNQSLNLEEYDRFFQTLPSAVQQGIGDRWQSPIEELKQRGFLDVLETPAFPIAGVQFGNVFVGVQPARGYDLDPSLNYHAPDLEPPHYYLAFYAWLRSHFGAQAIVHVGKHGNLEWLPGKGTALSAKCYPEAVFGAMPHLYPFIVNDPGEGSQAKRRSQAVILDHLTPPLTRAELYGGLQQLETLMDEYYEAQSLDPSRLTLIRDRILALIDQTNLDQDLALQSGKPSGNQKKSAEDRFAELLTRIDGYLCELKEAQIRDGLHIFGSCPTGRQLRDLIVSIARHPGKNRIGLTRAIAQDWGLAIDPLTADPAALVKDSIAKDFCVVGSPVNAPPPPNSGGLPNQVNSVGSGVSQKIQSLSSPCQSGKKGESATRSTSHPFSIQSPPPRASSAEKTSGDLGGDAAHSTSHPWRTIADVIESLELTAAELIDHLLIDDQLRSSPLAADLPATQKELHWIAKTLLPALKQTDREITNLLHGLSGGYVPSGASGAPTRGRPEVLPTGRNFYSVDIRAIPTMTAWDVGRKAAENLIEQYAQEQGEYPRTLALSIWGTSTMRTGGDDFAEALALLGVQPVWEGSSGRVIDFEILPLSVLGRPRVDVTLRISGFFRDAFPNLIDLFQQAIVAVAALDEPLEQNPLASQVQQDSQNWQQAGLSAEQATDRAQYRIFGSKPGAYGAGLQGLIDAQNWTDDSDLARAYLNWSSYAYTGKSESFAPEAFEQRLRQMQIVLHNQDNREHDLLDSDDYYQFQGGLTAAVRTLSGTNPTVYFGDHALPENPKLRRLEAEIARVYRSRVVNPKWIAGVMRHGYKGAFEMAATVDYLFAYDATARCVQDYMYQGIADAYLFNSEVQTFIQQKNPWALRDMAERLLEANQRGLWQEVNPQILEKLRSLINETEGAIEAMS